jgi:hypothetical protein
MKKSARLEPGAFRVCSSVRVSEIRWHARRQKVLVLEQPFKSSCLRQVVREELENPRSNRVGMKWTTSLLLLRLPSYFRRYSWMH